jgi:hypothetical protein
MAFKKDVKPRELDPAVRAIMSEDRTETDRKRDKMLDQTPAERRKAERDKKRVRRMIDPHPDLLRLARETAIELKVTENQVINYWAHIGANAATINQMSDNLESNNRSMRYPHKLRLPDLPERIKKGR